MGGTIFNPGNSGEGVLLPPFRFSADERDGTGEEDLVLVLVVFRGREGVEAGEVEEKPPVRDDNREAGEERSVAETRQEVEEMGLVCVLTPAFFVFSAVCRSPALSFVPPRIFSLAEVVVLVGPVGARMRRGPLVRSADSFSFRGVWDFRGAAETLGEGPLLRADNLDRDRGERAAETADTGVAFLTGVTFLVVVAFEMALNVSICTGYCHKAGFVEKRKKNGHTRYIPRTRTIPQWISGWRENLLR